MCVCVGISVIGGEVIRARAFGVWFGRKLCNQESFFVCWKRSYLFHSLFVFSVSASRQKVRHVRKVLAFV